ncbi:MAG: alpha/beta fold hydrolase [Chloroflexi bacterium]|nr:alpha/beta fold hydrolase [Chloroflexota bacterium]
MKLHYSLHSPEKSETVLLLHGMGSCGDDWGLQFPALAPHYRVLAPDARGHGLSPKPPGPYSIPQMTDEVVALLDDLRIESAHVVGLSMGGCMAQQMALAHPARALSLTLVNTFAKIRPAGVGGIWRLLQRLWALRFGAMKDVVTPIVASMFPKAEQAELRRVATARFIANNPDKQTYRAVLGAVAQFNTIRELSRIACPTLIVAGDRDRTVPMSCKRDLHRGIPNAELAIVEDSGHGTPIDQPERFNTLLVEFLQKQASQPSADLAN